MGETASQSVTATMKMENYWKNWKPEATRNARSMETSNRMENSSGMENSSRMEERMEMTSFKGERDTKPREYMEDFVDFDRNVVICDKPNGKNIVVEIQVNDAENIVVRNRISEYTTSLEE